MSTQHPIGGVRSAPASLFNVPALTSARRTHRQQFSLPGVAFALVLAAILLVAAPQAQSATYYWSALSGDWSAASNWGGIGPTASDEAYIINGGTAVITNLDTGAVCNDLFLGDPNSANSGAVQMSGGSLSAANSENLGNNGIGTFVQSGGTNTIVANSFSTGSFSNSLNLGCNPGASGSYSLSSSGVLSAPNVYVGSAGTGTFAQFGGTNTIANSLYLGYNMGSSGTYTLSGSGVLSAPSETVGNSGTGTFAQTGGTNTVGSSGNGSLSLGSNMGSSGTYTLSGSGVLTAPSENVGGAGTGALIQTGGTNSVGANGNGFLSLGSSGTYTLSGSGALSAYAENVGNSSTGTFTQSGGTNIVTSDFQLNGGTYNLTGGALNVPAIDGTGGTFNLGGGTLVASTGFSTFQAMTLTGSGGSGNLNTGGTNSVTLSGAVSGTGGLYISGGGTLQLAGSNTYCGGTTIPDSGTTLVLNNAAAVQNSIVTLSASSGGLMLNTNAGSITTFYVGGLAGSGSGSLTDIYGYYSATLSIGGSGTSSTYGGALSGAGGLTKTGSGTLVLTGSNSYMGPTTISGGVLKLDFSQTGAPTSNIINNANDISSSLVLSTGTLAIQGNLSMTNSQQFNNLMVNPGASAIVMTSSSPLLLNLGVINRSEGGTIDFTLPSGAQSANNGIIVGNEPVNGILGGYATIGGTTWAGVSIYGNIGAFSAYTYGDLGAMNSDATLNLSPTGTQTAINSAEAFNTLNLTGTEGVTMSGAGSLTLLGGGLIGNTSGTISGGSLQGSSGTAGELIVITPLNLTIGSMIVDSSTTGSTALTKAGPAMLTLTASNSYSGGTTIAAGTLQVSGSGSLGTGPVADFSALVFNASGNPTFGGAISGAGSLTQAGTGIVTLTGSNTYSGNTTVSAGTLQVGSGGSGEFLGSPSVSLSNSSASLVFSQSDSLTYSGVISGSGSLTQAGPGILTLTGSNTYTGGTNVSAGTLQVGDGGSGEFLASPSVSLSNSSASLVFNQSDSLTYSGIISGNGSLTQAGTGILTLTGSSTFTGGATISAGTLQVSGTGALGTGSVTNNSALVFNLSGAPTFGGVVSGNGSLTQAGTGVLTLTGSNVYTGATTISAGTLQVSGTGALGTGSVIDNTELLFNLSGAPTFGSNISGSGSLMQSGTGILTLTGNNTYTGGTTVSAGTLQIGNGGSGEFLGSPSVTISNSASLVFNQSDSLIYSGVIGGNGSLTQSGPGVLTLTGSNTYTGSTTVSAGTLQIGNGGSGEFLGSPSVTLGSGASLVFSQSDSLTYSGIISGNGNLTQAGPGLLTLIGSNTYSGGTTISAGTLQVGNGLAAGTLGASSGAVVDNGTLVFNLPSDSTFSGAISGNGSLTQAGTGVLTLTSSNTYTGSTTVSAGTLQVGNGGSGEFLGSPSVTLSNSAALVFSQSDSLTYSGAIGGSGSLTQAGPGVLTLLGNNNYSGSTAVSGGTLQVGNGGSDEFLGSPSVTLSNSASLVFNHSDLLFYSCVISGNGSLTQTGTGILTLTGSNTYTGCTTVLAGILQVGDGGSGEFLGSPSVSLSNSAALVFSQADSLTYSGIVSGSGSLTQAGPGLLTLVGSNTYGGGTTISSGTLQVGNGILAGALGTGAVIDNGMLVFNLPGAPTFSDAISGNGSLTQAGTGVLTLLGSNTFSGGTTISTGTLQLGNGGTTGTLTGGIAVGIGTALVLDRSDNVSMNFSLAGPGALVKTGSDTVTLTGNSTGFAGPISVLQGQLVLTAPVGMGAATVSSGGTLEFSGANVNLGSAYGSVQALTGGVVQYQNASINGGNLFGPGAQVLSASSNNTFNDVTINAGTPLLQNGPATFTNVTNHGQITGSGGLVLFGGENDGGTIVLSGTNNVSAWGNDGGAITIQSGGLLNNHVTNLPSYGGGQITINSGGTLDTDSDSQGLSLNLQGSLLINEGTVAGTINAGYGSTITGSGAFGLVNLSYGGTLDLITQDANVSVLTGNGTVNHSGAGRNTLTVGSGAFAGTIENGGGTIVLLKTGSGQLILSGSNNYSGGTIVDSGILLVTNSSALADGSSLTVGAGAEFLFGSLMAAAPVANSQPFAASPGAVATVPEPGTSALLGVAGIVAAAAAWQGRRKARSA